MDKLGLLSLFLQLISTWFKLFIYMDSNRLQSSLSETRPIHPLTVMFTQQQKYKLNARQKRCEGYLPEVRWFCPLPTGLGSCCVGVE